MVYSWIDEYNAKGFIGLNDPKGQGRNTNFKREIRENNKRVGYLRVL